MNIREIYGEAIVRTREVEDTAIEQIKNLCNEELSLNQNIVVMPDVHAGAACVIGLTMTITDKVVPNLVGVDIGCGVMCAEIPLDLDVDFSKIDERIKDAIPMGFNIHSKQAHHTWPDHLPWSNLHIPDTEFDINRAKLSMGTLGGGNHFIEIAKSTATDKVYLLIHTGSRNFGKQIADYYTAKALSTCTDYARKEFAYLSGEDFHRYLHDMSFATTYAYGNRLAILMNIHSVLDEFYTDFHEDFDSEIYENNVDTVHNYIGADNILRKGAVSALRGEKFIIPFNMGDGSLLCEGLGNRYWNYSAPHGAGRVKGRKQALRELDIDTFTASMEGVYSSCISTDTLDESPQAYKATTAITEYLHETCNVIDRLKPIYNVKG